MNFKQTLLPISFWLYFSLCSYAQVTIGSDRRPVEGALLDIKENTNRGVNALKGLGLPRVTLTNINPTTPNALASSIGSTGSWSLTDHTGMLIYNVNEDLCATTPIFEGLYVWNGKTWKALNRNMDPEELYIYTDPRDEESYTYRRFGNAGIWMTQNLRATKYSDGTSIDVYEGSNTPNPPAKAMYGYPTAIHPNWDVKSSKWKKEFGVFYNYPALTRDYPGQGTKDQSQPDNSGVLGQYEVESDTSLPVDYRGHHIVQGICPDGWHVPSDREWNELEKEIYLNANQYSTFTSDEVTDWNTTTPWDPAWEIHTDATDRPSGIQVHGTAMKSACPVNSNRSYGKSKPASLGGFEIPLAGHLFNQNTSSYGTVAIFMCSSSQRNEMARDRMFTNILGGVHRGSVNKSNLAPVRCKKNDLNL